MTTKTKPAPDKVACAKCGTLFVPVKPWQTFCSTRCRVNVHQAQRYIDHAKAHRSVPKLREKISKLRDVLAQVEMFIEQNPSSEARELLKLVRPALRGKRVPVGRIASP